MPATTNDDELVFGGYTDLSCLGGFCAVSCLGYGVLVQNHTKRQKMVLEARVL